jgi:hypothetical protein
MTQHSHLEKNAEFGWPPALDLTTDNWPAGLQRAGVPIRDN